RLGGVMAQLDPAVTIAAEGARQPCGGGPGVAREARLLDRLASGQSPAHAVRGFLEREAVCELQSAPLGPLEPVAARQQPRRGTGLAQEAGPAQRFVDE